MPPRRGFELNTGSVFGEPYKVVKKLGAGSEGEVTGEDSPRPHQLPGKKKKK